MFRKTFRGATRIMSLIVPLAVLVLLGCLAVRAIPEEPTAWQSGSVPAQETQTVAQPTPPEVPQTFKASQLTVVREYRLSSGDAAGYLHWSPDGSRLAFEKSIGPNLDASDGPIVAKAIWVVNADGSNEQRVVDGFEPQWNPSGDTLAYLPHWSRPLSEVWMTDLMGVATRKATDAAPFQPQFVDSNTLAVVRDERIVLVSVATGSLVRDLNIPLQEIPDLGGSAGFQISPDGTNLLHWRYPDLSVASLDKGALIRLNTKVVSDMSNVSWSPDSTTIVWIEAEGPQPELWVARADGTDKRLLASDLRQHWYTPTWSPDGQVIVFSRCSTGSNSADFCEIWVINQDGTELSQLTHNQSHEGWLQWSPTGHQIAFLRLIREESGDSHTEVWAVEVSSSDGSGTQMEPTPTPTATFAVSSSIEAEQPLELQAVWNDYHPYTQDQWIKVIHYPDRTFRAFLGIDSYLKGVIPQEWAASGYSAITYKTAAIVARSYAGNSENWYAHTPVAGATPEHPVIYDSTYAQVWDNTPVPTPVSSQYVDETSGIFLVYNPPCATPWAVGSNNHIVNAMHDNEQGPETIDNPSGLPYLKGVPDPVHGSLTPTGHRYGACQTGIEAWYQAGVNNQVPILMHYYSRVELQRYYSLTGAYYPNTTLSGNPSVTRTDSPVNFDWGSGAPKGHRTSDSYLNQSDGFSVRWTGNIYLNADGWYTFYVTSDDGVRLWIDNIQIIDKWQVQCGWDGKYSSMMYLTTGNHSVKLEYYDNTGGAHIRFSWTRGKGLIGRYYNNMTLTGTPALVRADVGVYHRWLYFPSAPAGLRDIGPDDYVNRDQFSVRWEGKLYAHQNMTPNFCVYHDDGVRLWVGGTLIIDQWSDTSPVTHCATRSLTQGQLYDVKLEYYENTYGAEIELYW